MSREAHRVRARTSARAVTRRRSSGSSGLSRASPGVELLDWSADPDHNRAVLTYVGEPEAVLAATQALCLEAFAIIDMRESRGGASPDGGRGRDPVRAAPRRDHRGGGGAGATAGGVDRRSRACPSTTTRTRPPARSGSRCPTCAGANTRVWPPSWRRRRGAGRRSGDLQRALGGLDRGGAFPADRLQRQPGHE